MTLDNAKHALAHRLPGQPDASLRVTGDRRGIHVVGGVVRQVHRFAQFARRVRPRKDIKIRASDSVSLRWHRSHPPANLHFPTTRCIPCRRHRL